jgi:hypothetical protein
MKHVRKHGLILFLTVCICLAIGWYVASAMETNDEEPQVFYSGDYVYILDVWQAIIVSYTGDADDLVIPQAFQAHTFIYNHPHILPAIDSIIT